MFGKVVRYCFSFSIYSLAAMDRSYSIKCSITDQIKKVVKEKI